MTWRFDPAPGRPVGVATAVATPAGGELGQFLAQPTPAEPSRLALGMLMAAVALAALVNPKLPGNAGPVDLLMFASVVVVFLWALRVRATLRVPYGLAVAGLMITGLLASLFGAYPLDGLTAIIQEIFLLFWCAAVATVCVTPRVLAILLRTWVVSATVWGAVLIVAVAGHVTSVSGVGSTADKVAAGVGPSTGAFRGRLFFDQPNMAGNYFIIALFILIASGFPRRRWLRAWFALVLIAATIVTGSNAAFLSLIGGAALTLFLHIRARGGMVKATAALGAFVLALVALAVTLVVPLVTAAQSSQNLLLRDTVGRGPQSAAGRVSLFDWQFKLYLHGSLLGRGPNATVNALGASASPILKSAHNDYLATLGERGPLGLLALLVLMGVLIARLAAITRRRLPPRLRSAVPVPAALAGACFAFALTAITHETLHYRWLWTLFGVVAAVHVLARQESAEAGDAGDVRTEAPSLRAMPMLIPAPRKGAP